MYISERMSILLNRLRIRHTYSRENDTPRKQVTWTRTMWLKATKIRIIKKRVMWKGRCRNTNKPHKGFRVYLKDRTRYLRADVIKDLVEVLIDIRKARRHGLSFFFHWYCAVRYRLQCIWISFMEVNTILWKIVKLQLSIIILIRRMYITVELVSLVSN